MYSNFICKWNLIHLMKKENKKITNELDTIWFRWNCCGFFLLQWQIDSKDIKKLNEITLYYIESICFIDRKNILCSVAKMYSHWCESRCTQFNRKKMWKQTIKTILMTSSNLPVSNAEWIICIISTDFLFN